MTRTLKQGYDSFRGTAQSRFTIPDMAKPHSQNTLPEGYDETLGAPNARAIRRNARAIRRTQVRSAETQVRPAKRTWDPEASRQAHARSVAATLAGSKWLPHATHAPVPVLWVAGPVRPRRRTDDRFA